MIINPETMLMARINKVANNRGITPYNNYFEKSQTNALCLELHNPSLKKLLDGMKHLDFKGAISVAFEYDQEIFELMDEIDPITKKVELIGFVTYKNGKYKGHAQGGWGLLHAIQEKTNLKDKKIVIFGSGHMTKGLLAQLEVNQIKPREIEIYNRTVFNAEKVGKGFPWVEKVYTLDEFKKAKGDILINTSTIGAPWRSGDDFNFEEKVISEFDVIVDVNFVPLKTNLIQKAEKLGKIIVPGWQTFKYGTCYCFENILDIKVDLELLENELVADFTNNWS